MSVAGFALDPRLVADTVPVGDLELSRVLLMDDANWPWLILVPRRAGLRELCELSRPDRIRLGDEIDRVMRLLQDLVAPDKLNVAALGNQVAQLHVHVIARHRDDPAWPAPVWGSRPPLPYAEVARRQLLDQLAAGLALEHGGDER